MVEIFYKTYYYIFDIFFNYYCILLFHVFHDFYLRLFYGK